MKHPDFRRMLPSKVRAYLSTHLEISLENAKLNCYCDPMYHCADALQEFRDVEGIAPGLVVKLYTEARAQYDRKHPKCWDNEKQKAFRG